MSTAMRAKMTINNVVVNKIAATETEPERTSSEQLSFGAVAASQYPEDGSDENNTYARFSPSASLNITICNPALYGKFKQGDTFYVDFIPVEVSVPENN